MSIKLSKSVVEFYLRDENSRITSGKKETITRKGVKKQRRLLNESMKVLHGKYQAENMSDSISYSVFCKLKPFWVVPPCSSSRLTCLCKCHENKSFLAQKLKYLNVLPTENLTELLQDIVCDTESKHCMYNECTYCKGKRIKSMGHDSAERTCWMQWKSKNEEKLKKRVKQNCAL